jgi:hypothetical protein
MVHPGENKEQRTENKSLRHKPYVAFGRMHSQGAFCFLFIQIFARRAKIWMNKSIEYLAAAGESNL